MYKPNCSLQCLWQSIFYPVTIVCGPNVGCTPSLCGKQFSQNSELHTVSTIRPWGDSSNSKVLILVHSLFSLTRYILPLLVHVHPIW